MVRELFDAGAPHYEWVCRVMSLGTGERYRAERLASAGLGERHARPGRRHRHGPRAALRRRAGAAGRHSPSASTRAAGCCRECRPRLPGAGRAGARRAAALRGAAASTW